MRLARFGFIFLTGLFPVAAAAITADQIFSGFTGAPIHIGPATSYRVKTGRERESYHSGVAARTSRLQNDRRKIVQEITSIQALQKGVTELLESCPTPETPALAKCISYGDALLDHVIDIIDIVNSDRDTTSLAQYVNLSEIAIVRLLQTWRTYDFMLRQDKFSGCNMGRLSRADIEKAPSNLPPSPVDVIDLFHLVLHAEAQSPEEATFCLWISPTDAQLAKLRNKFWIVVASGEVTNKAEQLCRAKAATTEICTNLKLRPDALHSALADQGEHR
jgi:hypothetical protein